MPIRIADAALAKCLCTKCGKLLSYPPVVIYQNDPYHKECCEESEGARRAFEYEALANYFIFPCLNKSEGCEEYFPFSELAIEHLDDCPYKPVQCPINENKVCGWKGSAPNLQLHFENVHYEYYLQKPAFRLDCTVTSDKYYLCVVKDEFIILQSRCDFEAGQIWLNAVRLPCIQKDNFLSYCLKLMPLDLTKPFLHFEIKTIDKCTNTFINTDVCEKVDLNAVVSIFNEPQLDCLWTINVQKQRDVLRCFECNVFMIPPIFRCKNGHTTCEDCKSTESCSRCESVFAAAVDLESISKQIQHPCRFCKCSTMDYNSIRDHEINCLKFHKKRECFHCKNYITTAVFTCVAAYHVYCETCINNNNNNQFCLFPSCKLPLDKNKSFENIFRTTLYECRIQNCDEFLQSDQIIKHEEICTRRYIPQRCSRCPTVSSNIWSCDGNCPKVCSSCRSDGKCVYCYRLLKKFDFKKL